MYYGLAISHELRTDFMYESDYASRESVYRNIDRAIEEVMNQPVTIGWDDFECHTANACEGMEERLQLMMRDSVAGNDGIDAGYAIYPRIIRVSQSTREESRPAFEDYAETGAEAVKAIATAHGFAIRETCLCVWVSGNTKPHREELKAAGAKWSGKRQAWYWRKEQAA